MGGKVIEVTDISFKDVVSKHNNIIVDCWAEWCGPCMMLKPMFEELSTEYTDVVFAKLDVDNNASTASEYGIMSIPTLLVFKNGVLVDKWIGALPKPMLKEKINEAFKK
jgi:thioredoxin 1